MPFQIEGVLIFGAHIFLFFYSIMPHSQIILNESLKSRKDNRKVFLFIALSLSFFHSLSLFYLFVYLCLPIHLSSLTSFFVSIFISKSLLINAPPLSLSLSISLFLSFFFLIVCRLTRECFFPFRQERVNVREVEVPLPHTQTLTLSLFMCLSLFSSFHSPSLSLYLSFILLVFLSYLPQHPNKKPNEDDVIKEKTNEKGKNI